MSQTLPESPSTPLPGAPSPAEISWHACNEEDTYRRLRTRPQGLTTAEVEERLREYGRNLLPGKKPPTLFQVIFHQFKSPLIYILLIAGAVSLAIGDVKDSVFIFAVILLNAAIGTVQEWRAEQSAHALQGMLKIQARVRRNGEVETLPAEELVPGDLVLLESGDRVPADMRLLQVSNLMIDEAFLTGESLPAQKRTAPLRADLPVSDQNNMAFAGATVVTGRGVGLVVATGVRTEVGRIARSITEVESAKPPLVIRMDRFAHQIGAAVLVCAALLGAQLALRGTPLIDVFFVMIALSVASIPEGLPVAMTVALSLATSRMASRKVIARRLVAVESLGSCTTIASDKTGTLTVNQQTVKLLALPDGARVEVSGQGYNDEGEIRLEGGGAPDAALAARIEEIVRAGVMCNEAALARKSEGWRHSGDSMDIALLALGYKAKIAPEEERKRNHLLGSIPFESERRYAAAAYRGPEGAFAVVKGAFEAVAAFCSQMRAAAGPQPFDAGRLQQSAQELAEGGYRVLAIAARPLGPDETFEELAPAHLHDMTLLGLVGFMDPLRPEVKEAVERAHRAGIKVVMITGDHPATALAIARQLGIAESGEQVLTGAELAEEAALDSPEFHERLRRIRVFARVTPQQKMDIVDGLMKLGEFVAVTGDGVNDAPALNRANIGVAMGSGTEVAKDAAQIIVTDDNFASIINGVEEGRYAYANVRKVTYFLITTGFAQIVVIALAVLLDLPLPFVAAQLLWLNLVTNGIQDVALAFEAGEKGLMNLPPRHPSEGIINRKMIEQVLTGGFTMAFACLAAWWYMLRHLGMEEGDARNSLLTLLILMQFYHVLNCRSEYRSAFNIPMRNNPVLMVGMGIAFLVHFAAMHIPLMQSLLRIAPIPLMEWLLLGLVASVMIAAMEIYKWVRRGDASARFSA